MQRRDLEEEAKEVPAPEHDLAEDSEALDRMSCVRVSAVLGMTKFCDKNQIKATRSGDGKTHKHT